jgi:hypothetical protein
MNRYEILDTIKSLASSQGFYGRLLRDLMELKDNDSDAYNELMENWENQNFGSPVDFVIYLEG